MVGDDELACAVDALGDLLVAEGEGLGDLLIGEECALAQEPRGFVGVGERVDGGGQRAQFGIGLDGGHGAAGLALAQSGEDAE